MNTVAVFDPKDLAVGPWPAGKPRGITLHHSADRNLEHVVAFGIAEKVGYHFIVDRLGIVHQGASLEQRVNHAGKANWLGMSPNREHLAVCVLSWGRLQKVGDEFQSWSTRQVPNDSVAERGDNFDGKVAYWDEATEAQEAALWGLLTWLCLAYKIPSSNICGHDECALPRGRKDDPGGVLSLSMPAVRDHINKIKQL